MSNPDRATTASLRISRVVRVSRERAFAAWTQPDQIMRWWGPVGVTCPDARVDLRVGGEYAIANRFADGRIVWIRGTFETVEPPDRLVYSWRLDVESNTSPAERVTVLFRGLSESTTEIVVQHERIANETLRQSHEAGWLGCLAGFAAYCDQAAEPAGSRSNRPKRGSGR
jgi:uncharacterized protein YndB with AHSA1/START domain